MLPGHSLAVSRAGSRTANSCSSMLSGSGNSEAFLINIMAVSRQTSLGFVAGRRFIKAQVLHDAQRYLLTDQIAQSSFQGNASVTPNPGQRDDDEDVERIKANGRNNESDPWRRSDHSRLCSCCLRRVCGDRSHRRPWWSASATGAQQASMSSNAPHTMICRAAQSGRLWCYKPPWRPSW